ncbi:MAG: alpha/beta fold hydrolase [Candidatus Heimdallarchaeaceae archaeon]
MKEDSYLEFVKVQDDPEIRVRILTIKSKNPEYAGRNFFLIMGWISEIDLFLPLANCLAEYGNVIIYEPRGFGKSFAPHKKGFFSIEEYNKEIASVLKIKNLQDKDFVIFGSCSGGAMAFSYYLDGDGPKPYAMAIISPQPHYKTPFWLPILGVIPNFIMELIQKLIILSMGIYLKFKKPEEVKNIVHAKEQLTKNDAWSQRRFVVEYIVSYDIRDRIKELDIPMVMFVGKEDHFLDLEQSKQFLLHPSSRLIELEEIAHRIQEGNEEKMAKETHEFLLNLGK